METAYARQRGPSRGTRGILLWGVLLPACAILGSCEAPKKMTDRTEGTGDVAPAAIAPLLHVALQEGFESVLVEVRINGEEVYRREKVLTDIRIGLADAFEIPMPERPVMVQVTMPSVGAMDSLRVDLDGNVYLGVSYLKGTLRFKVSGQPFGYL